jgi:hypothetical protein
LKTGQDFILNRNGLELLFTCSPYELGYII